MGIKIRTRSKKNGGKSILLDISFKNKRKLIFLKALELLPDSTQKNQSYNRKVICEVEKLVNEYRFKLQQSNYDFEVLNLKNSDSLFEWIDDYISRYDKKDLRNVKSSARIFKSFISVHYPEVTTFSKLNARIIESFMCFLEKICKGEGAQSYYKRFKKMMMTAYKAKILKENLFFDVTKKIVGVAEKKETLTIEELKLLYNNPFRNKEVADAFLLCCSTGMSWCDVKKLEFKDLNLEKSRITYKRMKTSTKTNDDVIVYYPNYIKDLLISRNKSSGLVFSLPSNNAANENLESWMKAVGINKKITWHCSRHTFGTLSVKNSKNIYLTAKQMGHSSTKHTLRYLTPDEDQLIESSKSFQII